MTTPARPEAGTRLEQLAKLVTELGHVVHRPDGAEVSHDGFNNQCPLCVRQVLDLVRSPAPVRASGEPLGSLSVAETQKFLGSDRPISIGKVPTDPIGMRTIAAVVRERLVSGAATPDYWRCNTCGCLWRDNHDGTLSLASAKQTSCATCEKWTGEPTCEPLFRAAAAVPSPPAQEIAAKNYDTREAMLHRRAQMAEADSDRWQKRYRDLLEAFDGLAGRFVLAIQAREKYALELRTIRALPSSPVADSPTRSILVDRDADVRREMRAYLDTLTIHGDNIGDIRRSLFMPFDSQWNGWVRDDTAERELPVPSASAAAPKE